MANDPTSQGKQMTDAKPVAYLWGDHTGAIWSAPAAREADIPKGAQPLYAPALLEAYEAVKHERYQLAYAITGGEDAPGLLDTVPVDELVKIARQHHAEHANQIDRTLRAERERDEAQAEVKRLKEARLEADQKLVDRYRNLKTGTFSFPDDVAAIVRALDASQAEVKRLVSLLQKVAPREPSKSWLSTPDYKMIRATLDEIEEKAK